MAFTKPFFGGNWKMNHGPTATRTFVESFLQVYPPHQDRTVVFFPPAISISEFREGARERPDLAIGVQDVYWEVSGAYTGSISAAMAKEAGASYALAGHSERRHVFGDSDESVGLKVAAITDAGLTAVLCVGERLEERERGEVESVVRRQLETGLSRLDDKAAAGVVVAYEPVWAIGTGRTARPEDANEVHAFVRALLAERVGSAGARRMAIIYGGSVKPGNIEELLASAEIDGVLVGGASLDPAGFSQICQARAR